jgi:hypothetical protein
LHVIGEETSERLDVIPAQFRVIVTQICLPGLRGGGGSGGIRRRYVPGPW